MTPPENPAAETWESLPCSCIVYRAILIRPWREKTSGKLVRGAFLRRGPLADGTPRDKDGLSVSLFLHEQITSTEIVERVKGSFKKCFGVGSLHVGKIRNIDSNPSLDVVRNEKHHANITGLPYPSEDPATAERLATQLAEQYRVMWEEAK